MKYRIATAVLLVSALLFSWHNTDASAPASSNDFDRIGALTPPPMIHTPVIVLNDTPEIDQEDMFEVDAVNYNAVQRECLALNIYHEAKNQSDEGQLAVGIVTLNRVVSSKYPNTICDVVKQAKKWKGKIIRHKCQFSWYCDGKSDTPHDQTAWGKAQDMANNVLDNYKRDDYDITGGSLWYHANYVKPRWASKLKQTTVVDDHIFYTAQN